ncbi:hypothetical protein ATEIFO6365_0007008000 [Aspergillus terreus]|uniref:Uncharacterized protein n=1 Tax=Aspergillus terreus TaxID=33178 RepID=A0A5M3Z3Y2_ASPTE|nr:hypothetical protein ATETN484_0009008000 [Aspergillus terreus]GFF17531.1 hypothetical protein ATEIFO6365_0007008000 [Aspergillus terreus]
MRTTLQLAIFLSATLTWALEQRIPGYEPTLVARGLPTMSPNCTRHSTCDSCFGDGYVVCDNAGCFNPDAAQQCCKNGNLCVAKDNGCCDGWGGPGVTGSSGTVPMPTATSTSALPESSSWSCTRFQGNEACCQGGGPDMHWCAGNFPNAVCYNTTVQICCSEGTVCEGEDCCGLVRIGGDPVGLVGFTNDLSHLLEGLGDGSGVDYLWRRGGDFHWSCE